ncbi:MAG: hypothetical protein II655_09165, partial [Thermoguttaceae bacterium]|nr:hypothetical protein [Thermoguttaceae bacterium]
IREGLERNGFEICSKDWLEDYDRAYRAAFDDAEKIKSAFSELEQASHAMSKALYEQAQQAQQTGATGQGATASDKKDGDDVIDAEFDVK